MLVTIEHNFNTYKKHIPFINENKIKNNFIWKDIDILVLYSADMYNLALKSNYGTLIIHWSQELVR